MKEDVQEKIEQKKKKIIINYEFFSLIGGMQPTCHTWPTHANVNILLPWKRKEI